MKHHQVAEPKADKVHCLTHEYGLEQDELVSSLAQAKRHRCGCLRQTQFTFGQHRGVKQTPRQWG
jgi:hypothetical protein